MRLRAENDRLRTEVALLREELRIKDERMGLVPAGERPRYPPHGRLAILAVRAARGWSVARTARAFLVTAPTVASWTRRVEEGGPDALVRMRAPVNKLPDFVTVVVQQLRAVCPLLGKIRIAQMLARAGLHISAATVGRALRAPPAGDLTPPPPKRPRDPAVAPPAASTRRSRAVTARRPHYAWHVDLTVMPALCGFWIPWLPYSVAQRWPFGVWIALVLDHHSRAVVARGVFDTQPSAMDVCEVLPSVMCVLRAYYDHLGEPPLDAHLIGDVGIERHHEEAKQLRADLRAAGIDRKILFSTAPNVVELRLHDMRATFCTWARRAGYDDAWIAARTGHRPSGRMIDRYARQAQTLADLDYEPFPDVAAAIPELADRARELSQELSRSRPTALGSRANTSHSTVRIYNLCEGGDLNPYGSYPASTSS